VDNIDHNTSSTSSQTSFHGTAISLVQHPTTNDWLTSTQQLISKDKLDPKDFVSWAAYKASRSALSSYQQAIITLLPMFLDNAHSMAMIAHSMRVIKVAVEHVNPSQAPVIALDQPLFALTKQIQWKIPGFGEYKFVVMMGGLHIEMASFKMLRKWLSGSGWPEVMCNAAVATQGIAESFLSASHVTRTRRAHQVTAASLFILLNTGHTTNTRRPY
jgi:hypothetical protein